MERVFYEVFEWCKGKSIERERKKREQEKLDLKKEER